MNITPEAKHSALPWKIIRKNKSGGVVIGNDDHRVAITKTYKILRLKKSNCANAAFIVRACNNFEALLNACKWAEKMLGDVGYIGREGAITELKQVIEQAEQEGKWGNENR